MFIRFHVAVLVGALASKILAQIDSSSEFDSAFTTPYSDYPPYPTLSSIPPDGNAISEYQDIPYLLSAIAPQVTSISPAQADQLEQDLAEFENSYTISNPVPDILSEDPNTLLDNPTQTLNSEQLDTIYNLMGYPTDPAAMSSLASILSGNSASSFVMAYESAEASYQNAAYSAIAPVVYQDLSLSGSFTLASQTIPASASASATDTSFSQFTTIKTTGKKTKTASGLTSATSTGNATSSASSASSATSTASSTTSASNSISSALAAPTAGPQVVYSAVVAAAGILGMAML